MNCEPGDVIAGKYRLLEPVGGGAMGQVFKAEHMLMGKTVAIKILHPDVSENAEMLQRFKREAQAAASISHSNICTVLDFDVMEDGDFYLVMEFLEGDTLQKRIREGGPLPPEKAVFIMQQLLSVLQCAHDHGIVHRDVKPENITLVFQDGVEDFVKLLDFGIAHQESYGPDVRQPEEFRTQMGFLYGTPEYVAPEQAEGGEIDYRVDLYSCGIILYEMLTGRVPFRGDSIVQILHDQVYTPMPHLPVADIDHGEELDAVIQKLTQKRREDRYQSALSASEALSRIGVGMALVMGENSGMGSLTAVRLQVEAGSGMQLSPSVLKLTQPGMTTHQPPRIRKRVLFAGAILLFVLGVILTLAVTGSGELDEVDVSGAHPANLREVSDVQAFLYESDFGISDEETLRRDPNILKAQEAFFQKDYKTCYENMNAVEDRYRKHPNYLRLRMQAASAYSGTKEATKASDVLAALRAQIVADFASLVTMVPDAVRNPAVRSAVLSVFPNSKKSDVTKIQELFMKAPSEALATGLALVIPFTAYDDDEYRRKNMLIVYHSLPHENTPQWLKDTLEAWLLPKDKCDDRRVLVEKIFNEGSREDVFQYVLTPLNTHLRLSVKDKSKRYRCGSRFKKADCNACMPWIEQAYKDWSALAKDGKLADAAMPFTPEEKTE